MPRATLLVHRLLVGGLDAVGPGFDEIALDCPGTETLPDLLRSLQAHQPAVARAIYDPVTNTVKPGIIVVVNDRIVHQHECSRLAVHDGDEITFIPMIDGG
jgi:sulfur carrier protein ThiS